MVVVLEVVVVVVVVVVRMRVLSVFHLDEDASKDVLLAEPQQKGAERWGYILLFLGWCG